MAASNNIDLSIEEPLGNINRMYVTFNMISSYMNFSIES